MLQVYLDNSATTPVDPRVIAAMEPYWQHQFGNPSSPHRLGIEAESVLEQCRKYIAQAFKVNPDELYFTSGGTEANNLAILGYTYAQYQPGHIITSSIEHPSVLNPILHLQANHGWQVSELLSTRTEKLNLNLLLRRFVPIPRWSASCWSIMKLDQFKRLSKSEQSLPLPIKIGAARLFSTSMPARL